MAGLALHRKLGQRMIRVRLGIVSAAMAGDAVGFETGVALGVAGDAL